MRDVMNLLVPASLILFGVHADAKDTMDTIKNVVVEGGIATVTATLATDRVLTLWVTDDLKEGWTRLYNGHPAVTGYLTGNPVDAEEFVYEMNVGGNKQGYCKVDLFDPDPKDLYRDLIGGESGDDVATLQVLLQNLGYLRVPLDYQYGTYDNKTKDAVRDYQSSVGITLGEVSYGFCGWATRDALMANLTFPEVIVEEVDTYVEAIYDDSLHGGVFIVAVDVLNFTSEDIFIDLDMWEHDFYMEDGSGWQGHPAGGYIAIIEPEGSPMIVNDHIRVSHGSTERLYLSVYLEPEDTDHYKMVVDDLFLKFDPYSDEGIWSLIEGGLPTEYLYVVGTP